MSEWREQTKVVSLWVKASSVHGIGSARHEQDPVVTAAGLREHISNDSARVGLGTIKVLVGVYRTRNRRRIARD